MHSLENSTAASYRPDMAEEIDSPRDFLREAFITYGGPAPATRDDWLKLCFTLLDMGLESISPDSFDTAPSCAAALGGFADILIKQKKVTAWRSLGASMKRALQENPDSFDEISRSMGYGTRATTHKHFRVFQSLFGDFKSRGDKSEASREECRERRTGAKLEREPSMLTLVAASTQ